MKTYKIEITETLQKVVEVEAESLEIAINDVMDRYNNFEIELDSDCFYDYTIEEYKE